MYVFRLSDLRVIIAVALILVAVLGLVVFHPVPVERYRAEEVVVLPWGEGPGQVGRITGLDGQAHGPRSFAVDADGYVYVGDTFNHRVLILDPEGTQVTEFAFAPEATYAEGEESLIQDIAVDSRRDIYVADFAGYGVYRYDHVGNLLQSWPLVREVASAVADGEETDIWLTERIEVHEPGEVLIARTRISAEEYRRDLSRIDLVEEKASSLASTSMTESVTGTWSEVTEPGQFYTFTATHTGTLITEWPTSQFDRTVAAWNGANTLQWDTVVNSERCVSEAALIGTDGRGLVYLGVNLNQPDGVIYRLDSNGVNYTLPVAANPEAMGHVYARVTGHGDIYTMSPATGGIVITLLRYSTRWTLMPRW